MKQKNVILMVVAVGCGLAAAILTSQMSARSGQVEQVEVLVAAKDLPVGTFLSKDELKTAVKRKRMPKDGLPPAFVMDEAELVDKRLARGVRMEETFNPKDLTKGGVITLPPGMHMVSLQVGVAQAAAGFVGPGSRVDILATMRLGNRLSAFPLLLNMLVVAVDTNTAYNDQGVFPSMSTVSFAVDRRQALLLELAKTRGCNLSLMLRHPETAGKVDETYSIEKVETLLKDEQNPAKIESPPEDTGSTKPKAPAADPAPAPPPAPAVEVVKVLVATEDLPPGTRLTNDLIEQKFKEKEFRKGDVEEALTADDLRRQAAEGKELVNGLARNHWVTGALIGDPKLKPSPREAFNPPKDLGADPVPKAAPAPAAPARKVHEVTLNTGSGTKVFVYEEVRPGEWRLVAERAADAAPPAAAPNRADDARPKDRQPD